MKLTMRDRSQRPQLSVAAAEVGWGRLEAQPLNSSDSTNAVPIAKQKIPHQLPSFRAPLRLTETLTVILQAFFKQEASHEQKMNICRTLFAEARVGSHTNRHTQCRYFGIHRRPPVRAIRGRKVCPGGGHGQPRPAGIP
jgi:hypothetical protein